MTEVFLERNFADPLTRSAVLALAETNSGCFDMHKVEWKGSLLRLDGQRLFCRFVSPDVESTRIALRQTGQDDRRIWPGSVHDAPAASGDATVVVERSFDEPVTLEEIQAIEDRGAWCLDAHNVTFIRTFFSNDRKRMICTYRAPDAESVRAAQRQAGMPFGDVWPFEEISPI